MIVQLMGESAPKFLFMELVEHGNENTFTRTFISFPKDRRPTLLHLPR